MAFTKEGLLGALQNQRSDVRSFAALKLAAGGEKSAIRPILEALAVERVDGTKIILAAAAAQLGEAEGFDALKNMCEP